MRFRSLSPWSRSRKITPGSNSAASSSGEPEGSSLPQLQPQCSLPALPRTGPNSNKASSGAEATSTGNSTSSTCVPSNDSTAGCAGTRRPPRPSPQNHKAAAAPNGGTCDVQAEDLRRGRPRSVTDEGQSSAGYSQESSPQALARNMRSASPRVERLRSEVRQTSSFFADQGPLSLLRRSNSLAGISSMLAWEEQEEETAQVPSDAAAPRQAVNLGQELHSDSNDTAQLPCDTASTNCARTSGNKDALQLSSGTADPSEALSDRMPTALRARLSKGKTARSLSDKPKSRKSENQEKAKEASSNYETVSATAFIHTEDPMPLLYRSDAIEFTDSDQSIKESVNTTEAVLKCCADLKSLDPVGFQTLMAWRLAVRRENESCESGTEEAPSQQPPFAKEWGDERALGQPLFAKEWGDERPLGQPSQKTCGAAKNLNEVREAMAAVARSDPEAVAILEGLDELIGELTKALKVPDITSAQRCKAKKQLMEAKAVKSRAERAARQGRSPAEEVEKAGIQLPKRNSATDAADTSDKGPTDNVASECTQSSSAALTKDEIPSEFAEIDREIAKLTERLRVGAFGVGGPTAEERFELRRRLGELRTRRAKTQRAVNEAKSGEGTVGVTTDKSSGCPAPNGEVHSVAVPACTEQATSVQAEVEIDDPAKIDQEIEKLNQKLRSGPTSAERFEIQKQLGELRSKRARAVKALREQKSSAGPATDSLSNSAAAVTEADVIASLLVNHAPQKTKEPLTCDTLVSVLVHPLMLAGCSSMSIGRIGLLGKRYFDVTLAASDPAFGDAAWNIICTSFAREHGLYCPVLCAAGGWRRLFFDFLWPARHKWNRNSEAELRKLGNLGQDVMSNSRDFNIQVAARFRPAEESSTSVQGRGLLVPLHQRLMALKDKGENAAQPFGEKDPDEFLDALLGVVMTDPVRLPSSGKICERSVIEIQLQHSAKDPFDGSALKVDALQPCEELRQKIQEWKMTKVKGDASEAHRLHNEELEAIAAKMGTGMGPEVIEALLEAQRMKSAGQRALADAAVDARRKLSKKSGTTAEKAEGEAAETQDVVEVADNVVLNDEDNARLEALQRGARDFGAKDEEVEEDYVAPRRDGARVLAVQPPTKVAMFQPGAGVRPFIFARVFGGEDSQAALYEHGTRGAVVAALNGFNACVMCYGQTSSGKTHTMFGPPGALGKTGEDVAAVEAPSAGVVLRAVAELLEARKLLELRGVKFVISAQYVQIYQDEVSDLVSGNAVRLRQESAGAAVLLQGAAVTAIKSLSDILGLLRTGEARKRSAETAMNNRSSRAHTVLAFTIEQIRSCNEDSLHSTSHLHLVDLAGSERVKKSKAQGARFTEAVGINTSLMVLARCITALVEEAHHVPFYESQLTTLLRSAFGGNSRTTCVVCCRHEDEHADETLQALRFGERCSMITNQSRACAATSVAEALQAIDTALTTCHEQMESLEARGKQNLPAYSKLRGRYETLRQKRAELGMNASD